MFNSRKSDCLRLTTKTEGYCCLSEEGSESEYAADFWCFFSNLSLEQASMNRLELTLKINKIKLKYRSAIINLNSLNLYVGILQNKHLRLYIDVITIIIAWQIYIIVVTIVLNVVILNILK